VVAACDAMLDIREFPNPTIGEDAGKGDAGNARDATVGGDATADAGGDADATADAGADADATADTDADAQTAEAEAGEAQGDASCPSGCPLGAGCEAGVCVCPPGEIVCGGACVDEMTSAEHCGGCGLACSTGCNAGRCVVVLHSGGGPEALAVNNTDVYWTDRLTIWSVPIDGGPTRPVGNVAGSTLGLALNATDLFWTESTGTVETMAIDGGTIRILASGQSFPEVLTIDSHNVYWVNTAADAGAVMMTPHDSDGSAPTVLATPQTPPPDVAVNGAAVYWTVYGTSTDGGATGSVQRLVLGRDGGPVTTLIGGMNQPMGIAVDSSNVYWANAGAGTIMRIPASGGTAVTLATSASPATLVVDTASVYWVSRGSGEVLKVPIDGGLTTTLATGLSNPVFVVVDPVSAYVTDFGSGGGTDGRIIRITPK
jgi:sugar lactone lactonase YvrE